MNKSQHCQGNATYLTHSQGNATYLTHCQSNATYLTHLFLLGTGWHKKTGNIEKPNKNWRNPKKKIIDRNWTITTCLL